MKYIKYLSFFFILFFCFGYVKADVKKVNSLEEQKILAADYNCRGYVCCKCGESGFLGSVKNGSFQWKTSCNSTSTVYCVDKGRGKCGTISCPARSENMANGSTSSGGSVGGNAPVDPLENVCAFCIETSDVWRIAGYVLLIIRILIPVILIAMITKDLYAVLFASDEKASKDVFGSIIKRIAAALLVFFLPTLVNIAINAADGMDAVKSDYTNCLDCLLSPTGGSCQSFDSTTCTDIYPVTNK